MFLGATLGTFEEVVLLVPVMIAGGAILREVGTTNKTHLRDYEQAMTENTAALLRVNPSNYRVIGFAKEVPVAELVTLKVKRPVLVIDDLAAERSWTSRNAACLTSRPCPRASRRGPTSCVSAATS
jgi:seryl-tRNA(Sec) selenium transferase